MPGSSGLTAPKFRLAKRVESGSSPSAMRLANMSGYAYEGGACGADVNKPYSLHHFALFPL